MGLLRDPCPSLLRHWHVLSPSLKHRLKMNLSHVSFLDFRKKWRGGIWGKQFILEEVMWNLATSLLLHSTGDDHTQLWEGVKILPPTKHSLMRYLGGRKDQIWETGVPLYWVLPSLSNRLSKDSNLNWKSDFCCKNFKHCSMPAEKIVEERLICMCHILSHLFNRPSLLLCITFKFYLI